MAVVELKAKKKFGIAKLTEKQKLVFDSYIRYRSIDRVSRELGEGVGNIYQTYQTVTFQNALKEYNESILDKVNYNSAVVIDELWKLYGEEDTPKKEKINILTLLGKHIGMWATQVKDPNAKPNVQYNIVNYNQIASEVLEHKEEILVAIQEDDTPQGFEVLTYDELT